MLDEVLPGDFHEMVFLEEVEEDELGVWGEGGDVEDAFGGGEGDSREVLV